MGSTPPFCTRSINSWASSIMVKSAPKLVSNTLSKPMRRRSCRHLSLHIRCRWDSRTPRQDLPGQREPSARSHAYSDHGWLPAHRRYRTFHTERPVGHTAIHWPQDTQEVSPRPISKAEPILVAKPLWFGPITPNSLNLFAHSHAAAAEDTLGIIPEHMDCGVVDLRRRPCAVVISFIFHAPIPWPAAAVHSSRFLRRISTSGHGWKEGAAASSFWTPVPAGYWSTPPCLH